MDEQVEEEEEVGKQEKEKEEEEQVGKEEEEEEKEDGNISSFVVCPQFSEHIISIFSRRCWGRWGAGGEAGEARRAVVGGGGVPSGSPVATSEGVFVQGTLSAALCHFNPANY